MIIKTDQVPSTDKSTILHELDHSPLTTLQLLTVAFCAVGFSFDMAEAGMSFVLSAVFSAPPYAETPQHLSWLLVAPYAGGMIGAPFFGWVADMKGRRLAMTIILLLLGISSCLAAFAGSVTSLTLFRVLSGLALGAYPPVMTAFLTDLLPPSHRGAVTLGAFAAGSLGAPLAIFMVRWLSPLHPFNLDGWRVGFIIFGAASVISGLLFLLVPEPTRWLLRTGRIKQALFDRERFRTWAIALSPPSCGFPSQITKPAVKAATTFAQLAAFVLMSFLAPWASLVFPLLSGAILVERGFRPPDALLYAGAIAFGPSIGSLITTFLIDRISRRKVLLTSIVLMIATGFAFVTGISPPILATVGLLFGIIAAIYSTVMSLYFSELFDTENRGRATANLWAVNRVGTVTGLLILLPILHVNGTLIMFGVMVVSLCIGFNLLLFAPRGRAREAVG